MIPREARERGGRRSRLPALIGLGLLLAALGAWWLGREPSAPAPRGRLLADTEGPMTLAVTVLTSSRRSSLRNQELVMNIANALAHHTRLVILVADPEWFSIRNPWPERIQFVPLSSDAEFSIWPQDPFVVLRDEAGGSRLLTPSKFERAGDREMAGVIATQLGLPIEASSLVFEGGNIVSDQATAFVGANAIRRNARALGRSEGEIVRVFEADLGRPVVVVGPHPQPVTHIDVALTPLGRGRVVVADTGLGARLAARELAERPDGVAAFERSAEAYFFGSPEVREVRLRDGRVLHPPRMVGATARAIEDSRAIAGAVDGIAEDLARRGYAVLRVPLLMTLEGPERPGSGGDPGYPVLTYNNVLLERVSGRDHAYIPEYGFAALDRAARRAWQAFGYDVHPVPGLTTAAMHRGALRCTVKVLARGRELPPSTSPSGSGPARRTPGPPA